MRKEITVISVIIIVMLFVSGCSKTTIPEDNTPSETAQQKDAQQEYVLKLDQAEYGDLIKRYCGDFFEVRGLEIKKVAANNCYHDIAVYTNNEALCELMEDTFMGSAEEDKDVCLAKLGGRNNRPEICEQLSGEAQELCHDDLEYYQERGGSSNE